MAEHMKVDVAEVRRYAARLSDAAARLKADRPALLSRLAIGAGERPVIKSRNDIKVTLGAAPYQHSGSRAGELVADRLKSCGDGYRAVEDGLRALGTVMAKMAAALEDDDRLTADELNSLVEDLHCVVLVVNGRTPDAVDWFGMEQT
ncbi:hypothetical protein LX16_1353 [Stackebrandtia albiflava]|uniref:Uncharacterized protein n=1 Tax=Stackebrandtia albiflava TaxID=406432 RepID=A0A562VCP7_9ACTN|nr:hypothetical protein [Stackebrandtia albiflava]TWJ15642.1 hypothetical protein LX16_1353 [Stackebrandtia albiflava]